LRSTARSIGSCGTGRAIHAAVLAAATRILAALQPQWSYAFLCSEGPLERRLYSVSSAGYGAILLRGRPRGCGGKRGERARNPLSEVGVIGPIDSVQESSMSDPRGFYDRPGDPMPDDRTSNSNWVIGAIVVIVLLVVAFAFYGNNASNTAGGPTTTTAQRTLPPTPPAQPSPNR
jgi:hypothetical protein